VAPPFKRVFVANRGEIAVRIVRACEALGIESVAAVSEADRGSLAARLATKSVCIGPAAARDSYLRPEILVTAALGTGCQAVHPGYGFLSERAAFSKMCADAGLAFIGPSPLAIEAMGDKITAVRVASEAGVPRVPGSARLDGIEQARREATRIGYPVLLKASAGGGGRGMRLVQDASDLAAAMKSASSEAGAAFGDATLYLEKFIRRARHIEIQILADAHANVVHLGERDCSVQRRYQKLIEESPSPAVNAATRERLAQHAISLARRVDYRGAGTVEFVYDEASSEAYFLEMNTRIQVEHPVTEMVTGRDLVAEQIRIAAGEPISFSQAEVMATGHAIECRINAEDPARGFVPGPGQIATWSMPQGDGVRVDSHCFAGYQVPPYYDSLLAKVIVHGKDRRDAIGRMQHALHDIEVTGVPTTISLHRAVMAHPDFQSGRITTQWMEERFLAHAAAVA
jgi:acetyl-CoA carboxylase biotin carboxylase subunit